MSFGDPNAWSSRCTRIEPLPRPKRSTWRGTRADRVLDRFSCAGEHVRGRVRRELCRRCRPHHRRHRRRFRQRPRCRLRPRLYFSRPCRRCRPHHHRQSPPLPSPPPLSPRTSSPAPSPPPPPASLSSTAIAAASPADGNWPASGRTATCRSSRCTSAARLRSWLAQCATRSHRTRICRKLAFSNGWES